MYAETDKYGDYSDIQPSKEGIGPAVVWPIITVGIAIPVADVLHKLYLLFFG